MNGTRMIITRIEFYDGGYFFCHTAVWKQSPFRIALSEFCHQMSNINNWSGRQLSFDSFLKLFMHGFSPEKSGFDARLNFVFWKADATGFLNHYHRVPRRHNSQASWE